MVCAVFLTSAVASDAQPAGAPYGTAKFESYKNIDEIKQLKVVWDFNFTDPRAVGTVFLAVSFPSKFDIIVNLKTAKARGLDEPLILQQRADEVIE